MFITVSIICIFRVKDCIRNGQAQNIISSIDKNKWFYAKFPLDIRTPLPQSGWGTFPSAMIPNSFSYDSINSFVDNSIGHNVESDSDVDSDYVPPTTHMKSKRRGRISFLSGHVQNLEDLAIQDMYYLKASIRASFLNVIYKVHVILKYSNSEVVEGKCECKASESRSCSHILAILFALEDYTMQFGYQLETCTSKLKTWNQGRKKGNNPQNVLNASYDNKTHRRRMIEFDPVPNKMAKMTEQKSNEFVILLQTLPSPSMFQNLIVITYENYDLNNFEKLILCYKIDEMISALDPPTDYSGPYQLTPDQNNNSWHNQRRIRITASVSKSFFAATVYEKKVNDHLWNHIDLSNVPAIKYGRDNEVKAFEKYKMVKQCDVRSSGFYINKKYAGLGCSPDGLIYNSLGIVTGILEIKCPYKIRHIKPEDIQDLSNIYYSIIDSKMRLNRTHAYYYQIQFCLAIMNVSFCDFVVWSVHGILIEHIEKDDNFIKTLMPKLSQIHRDILLVEFFEMRLPRNLKLLTL